MLIYPMGNNHNFLQWCKYNIDFIREYFYKR